MVANSQQFGPHQDTVSRHESIEIFNVIGGAYGERKYNPNLNICHRWWKDRLNLSYGKRHNQQGGYVQPSSLTKPPLEDVIYKRAHNLEQFQQETR
ncbi:hypothetical protein GQ457_10G011380 [Hibiscus cannabinus]